jgi:hypothetical protein
MLLSLTNTIKTHFYFATFLFVIKIRYDKSIHFRPSYFNNSLLEPSLFKIIIIIIIIIIIMLPFCRRLYETYYLIKTGSVLLCVIL